MASAFDLATPYPFKYNSPMKYWASASVAFSPSAVSVYRESLYIDLHCTYITFSVEKISQKQQNRCHHGYYDI